ncbi:PLP-dependent transferase [Linderina pennispora]|uniref:PLP-dependent transferase n=1 Tax=Linderina pennispora TaxID=61395 RepID=A0A1Y1WM34_9FUNG|nr:PLP-dependent transferase [Linderina pennispora]ORX74562.1 PLP-dependent transferase [Linderina pennispora]
MPVAPHSKDLSGYFTQTTRLRKNSPLKSLLKYMAADPTLVSLGAGLPHPATFPFASIGGQATSADTAFVDASISAGDVSSIEGLDKFLQYGNGRGVPSYSKFAMEHTERVHNPKYSDWDVVGLMLFCEHGDTLLVDEWTYPAIMETVAPMGIELAPVAMDSQGIVPEALDKVVAEWDGKSRKPRVAKKHNLVLIEDDPYYYLQFAPTLVPSLLSLDTEGRVIRLDSFSKVLAPGLRILPDKIQFHNETSTQQPSGLSQALVSRLMNEDWGHSGWEKHLVQIQREYAVRRDVFVDLCFKYLKGKVEFTDIFDAMIENHVMLVPGYMFSPLGQCDEVMDKPYMRAAFSYASIDQFETAVSRFAEALAPFTN